MKKILIASLFVFSALMGIVGFAQSITITDNGPATPTTEVRSFATPTLPSKSTLKISTDLATTTDDVSFYADNMPISAVRFAEIATTAALLEPVIPGVVTFQFNTDDNKLYIRLMEADGTTWGCVATLSDDLTSALN